MVYYYYLTIKQVKINLEYFKKASSDYKYQLTGALVFGIIAWVFFFQ
jgi:hypothetical protein